MPSLRNRLRDYQEWLQRRPLPVFSFLIESMTSRRKISYSFYGEDLVVAGIQERYFLKFREKITLSYIDIGAWRPIAGSNTYWLYKKGLSGTIVEPNPHFTKLWKHVRPRDNFLPVGCSTSSPQKLLIFHDGAASNTLVRNFADKISQEQSFSITNEIEVPCLSLAEIIQRHLKFRQGDFILDLDIEGMDLQAIESYDFPKGSRPSLILVEDSSEEDTRLSLSGITKHLSKNGYNFVARTAFTSIYVDMESKIASVAHAI